MLLSSLAPPPEGAAVAAGGGGLVCTALRSLQPNRLRLILKPTSQDCSQHQGVLPSPPSALGIPLGDRERGPGRLGQLHKVSTSLAELTCSQTQSWASPSAPSVSSPHSGAELGPPVTFTCTSGGFSPRDIAVTWLKKGAKLPAPQPRVLPEHKSVSYNMSSTVSRA
ncbi:unnamed protein product [Eretmochelys imbricata]